MEDAGESTATINIELPASQIDGCQLILKEFSIEKSARQWFGQRGKKSVNLTVPFESHYKIVSMGGKSANEDEEMIQAQSTSQIQQRSKVFNIVYQ